jgi:proteasome assembly chaperone (PAC2) family protein
MTLATIKSWPNLDRPILVVALEGWIDAGAAGTTAVTALLNGLEHIELATFDADLLVDHRARRPILRIANGVHSGMRWPEIKLQAATHTGGRSLLVLSGPEPDFRWHEFTAEVVSLALRLGVEQVVGLGAFPAPVPHTRQVRLAATSSDAELVGKIGFLPATIDVPAGVQAVLEEAFGQAGIPSVGVWARVPHYVSGMPYPEAAAALLDELANLADISIDTSDLHSTARQTSEQIDSLIAASEEHSSMVHQLEAQHDAEVGLSATEFTRLPSGDEIAAELERFLRGEGH